MTYYIPMKLVIGIVGGIFMAICFYIATVWLTGDDQGSFGGKTLKKYRVCAEYIVSREVAIVYAESGEAAEEQAKFAAVDKGRDIGANQPEIVWAEEIEE